MVCLRCTRMLLNSAFAVLGCWDIATVRHGVYPVVGTIPGAVSS